MTDIITPSQHCNPGSHYNKLSLAYKMKCICNLYLRAYNIQLGEKFMAANVHFYLNQSFI